MFKHLKSPAIAGKKSLFKGKVLLVLVVMLLCISFSYAAKVKYHGLGDDATKIYVKEIKLLPLDYKNYFYYFEPSIQYIVGYQVDRGVGYISLVDPITYRVVLQCKGDKILDITEDKKLMLVGYSDSKRLDLWDMKNKRLIKTFTLMKEFNHINADKTKIYDKDHIINLIEVEKGYDYIAIGDINTGEVKKVCEIKDSYATFDFYYFDKDNVFYTLSKDGVEKLYRLRLKDCSKKMILKDKDIYIDDDIGYYRNKDGEIRIKLSGKIIDRDGHIVGIIPDVYKKWQKICGVERLVEGAYYNLVSPDDKLILTRVGETDEDGEYWVKGGRRCVFLYDFKGNVIKLNLGMGDRKVPSELYWHPLGDRLFMRELRNGCDISGNIIINRKIVYGKDISALKLVILGRR